MTADARCPSLCLFPVAHSYEAHQVIILVLWKKAGIKMATYEDLCADQAHTIGAEKTALKRVTYCTVVCVKPLILGYLEGAGIGNSPAI